MWGAAGCFGRLQQIPGALFRRQVQLRNFVHRRWRKIVLPSNNGHVIRVTSDVSKVLAGMCQCVAHNRRTEAHPPLPNEVE